MTDSSFKLKGGMLPISILELSSYDSSAFADALMAKVQQSPEFFKQSLVVLDIEKVADDYDKLDLALIKQACKDNQVFAAAIKGPETASELAEQAGLAFVPSNGVKSASSADKNAVEKPAASSEKSQTPDQATLEVVYQPRPSKVVTQPVRSGQQVYAADADLIVLAAVSEGAEVLADGNIHIYGPLRGRALAGVKGDDSARIFCQSLEAELLSIAGHFKVHEDLQGLQWGNPTQIHYQDETLILKPLS